MTAVIPARDEAECVGQTVASLLRQDYPGEFNVVLVDDQSRDGTAQVGARRRGGARRRRPPDGAVGARLAGRAGPASCGRSSRASRLATNAPRPPDYLLLTDADIVYAPDALHMLVARAQCRRPRAHLADGETALQEFRRAHVRAGFHFLLSDALSVRLGQRSAPRDRGGGRRLHAGAARDAARGRRHRGDPRRADRRLHAWRSSSSATARSRSR